MRLVGGKFNYARANVRLDVNLSNCRRHTSGIDALRKRGTRCLGYHIYKLACLDRFIGDCTKILHESGNRARGPTELR